MRTFLREWIDGGPAGEPFRLSRLHALEDGKISLSALFVALAFFVTIGFVGNAEMAVFRKLETQNAADSMALASSTWRARGMNAITANNHLMGEISAIITVIEGLGGPELDGSDEQVPISADLNDSISNEPIPSQAPLQTVVVVLIPLDQQYVNLLIEIFTEDGGNHDAGATIFDGQMTMKALVYYGLNAKIASNGVYKAWILLSFGTGTAAAEVFNISTHLLLDTALLVVVKDWYLTKGVEVAASVLQPAREKVFPLVLRGLSLHGDTLADRVKLRQATEGSLKELASRFQVAEFETFPLMKDFSLPIEKEEKPASGTGIGLPRSLSETKPDDPPVINEIKEVLSVVQDVVDTINDALAFIPGDLVSIPLPSFDKGSRKLTSAEGGGWGFAGNHSFDGLRKYGNENSPDWEKERVSQWVRATYPHVDELRRSFRELFGDFISTSGMSSHFVHWTNRYTLSASHRLRSEGDGDDRHLYVVKGSKADSKGTEPWTNSPQQAEEMFAVQVFVKRPAPPAILTPPLFRNPNTKGIVSIGESLVYNANGRRVTGPTSPPGMTQPDTGWDTLNWKAPVRAFEWGPGENSPGDLERATSMFSAGQKMRSGATTHIELNWQSKLAPNRVPRLESALSAPPIRKFFDKNGPDSLLPDPKLLLH